MSLLSRRIDHDADERAAALADAEQKKLDVRAVQGRLTFLTESLRKQNETNHFAERIRAAYGRGYSDGQSARSGG